MSEMKPKRKLPLAGQIFIALVLAIIGGLNWGSVGLFRFDLVAWLFGGQTATVSRVIYTLVGLSAIWCISLLFRSDAITDEG